MSRAVVPELPQCKRDAGSEMRAACTETTPSRTGEMSAPSWRSTRAVDFTSAPVRSPVNSLVPRASAASITARCEMLLSPGGRTTPRTFTRRPAGATAPRG